MSAHRVGLAPMGVGEALALLAKASDPHRPIMLHLSPEAFAALNVRRVVVRRRRLFGRWRR